MGNETDSDDGEDDGTAPEWTAETGGGNNVVLMRPTPSAHSLVDLNESNIHSTADIVGRASTGGEECALSPAGEEGRRREA